MLPDNPNYPIACYLDRFALVALNKFIINNNNARQNLVP